MEKNIIILGPPGSGKGTQAKRLAEKLNLTYFGTGDLIRAEIEKNTKLGKEINTTVQKGQLISDEAIDHQSNGNTHNPMVAAIKRPKYLESGSMIETYSVYAKYNT